MGLVQLQAALARLYTDTAFRALLQSNPEAVQRECALTDAEIEQLAETSSKQLSFFAESLVSKRRGEVAKILPMTTRALGTRFRAIFGEYAKSCSPTGLKKHGEDAVGFAAYVADNTSDPPWLADVARYESGWQEMSNPGKRVIVRWLQYPVSVFMRSSLEPRDLIKPSRCVVVWWRPTTQAEVRHRIFTWSPRSRRAAHPMKESPPTGVN